MSKFIEKVSTSGEVADGKIINVKILGYNSKNGRVYSREAVNAAVDKYNDSQIYVNHSGGARKVEDKFGKFTNVHATDEGLFGDVTFLETHPMTPRFAEDIKKNLNMFGMSHSIIGSSSKKDGIETVDEITSVESVDIVSNPATTCGFFEQVEVIEEVEVEAPQPVEDKTEVNKLLEEINILKQELNALKESKKQPDVTAVICQPFTIDEQKTNSYPTDLKKFFEQN